jgi:putative oxidoreductase
VTPLRPKYLDIKIINISISSYLTLLPEPAMATAAFSSAPTRPRWQHYGLWALQALLALAFLVTGSSKLTGAAAMVQLFDAVGVGQWARYVTGTLEVMGAIGLLVPRLTSWAGLGLAAVMAGAVFAHLTVLHTPFFAPAILGALALTVGVARRNA